MSKATQERNKAAREAREHRRTKAGAACFAVAAIAAALFLQSQSPSPGLMPLSVAPAIRAPRPDASSGPLDEDITPDTWRSVSMVMQKPDGSRLEISLLRPVWWLDWYGVAEGADVELDMEEFGASGPARVLSVGPCSVDSRENTPGSNVVIGKFTHDSDNVWQLYLNDAPKPLGVTAKHPIFSKRRAAFVEAASLEIGEEVETIDGRQATVTRLERLPGRHKVYNLEVHRDHTFFVAAAPGSPSVWVHNSCAIQPRYDSAGRLKSVFAKIEQQHLGTGTSTNSSSRAAVRNAGNATDDAGHLIARRLGGEGGVNSQNLIPQDPHVNRGAFRVFEKQIADEVAAGRDVFVRVSPKYSGAGTRPVEIVYQVRVDGASWTPRIFPN